MRSPRRRLAIALAVLAVTVVCGGLAAASAPAAGWHSNRGVVYPSWTYPGGYTTTQPNVEWVVGGTTVSCFFGWVTGSLTGTPTAFGVVGPGAGSFAYASATPKFGSCFPAAPVSCQGDKVVPVPTATLSSGATAASYNSGTATTYAGAASRSTVGSMLSVDCEFRIGGVLCVTVTGSIPITYTNPSAVGGTLSPLAIVADTALDAKLTLRSAGQVWAVAGPGCAGLPNPGAAAVRLQKPGGGDLSLPVSGGTDQPVVWYGTL